LIGSSLKTLEHWALDRSTFLDPGHKIKTNMFPYSPPFQFIYRVELWAKPNGINQGAIGNVFRNNLGTWGTFWEPNNNHMGT
jgi:hypothetical protein